MAGKRVILAILLIMTLISASRVSYLLFFVLTLLIAAFLWQAKMVFAGVVLDCRLSNEKAYIGQEVTVTITALNPHRLPLGWIGLRVSRQPNLEVSGGNLSGAGLLTGKGHFSLDYRITGARRGYYRLGEIRLAGGDPLGWSRSEKTLGNSRSLTIFPPITPLTGVPLLNVRPFGALRDRLRAHEDPTRLAGVRDYRPGDSLRHIHWKASAKRNELQVKELVPTVTAASLILLDLDEEEYEEAASWDLGEVAVEAAASLIVHLIKLDTLVGLVTNGLDPESADPGPYTFPPGPGPAQAEAILTLLARIRLARRGDILALLKEHGRAAPWGTSIFVIAPRWREEMTTTGIALRKLGKKVVPVILGAKDQGALKASSLFALRASRDRDGGGVWIKDVR